MSAKVLESSVFISSMGEDGILRTTVKPFSEITISHARENTEFVLKLKNKETVPILVDLRNIKSISKEARAHFSMKGRKGAVNSMALIIKSPVSKVIGNFFILLDTPLVPTRLFTKESDAVLWLKAFLMK